ncbi:hypothetical protein DFH08DRAFT_971924 [Mycena albidolilacea]|uniref:Uncharacterized protein n=1 Tax=Mycena albidolilacea TaxID=1033008 RepID=A0AAD7EE30_9AGAR|nr:hypothetical protein DFH08DRAFT_971924 [Mycena albidolilacea]
MYRPRLSSPTSRPSSFTALLITLVFPLSPQLSHLPHSIHYIRFFTLFPASRALRMDVLTRTNTVSRPSEMAAWYLLYQLPLSDAPSAYH